MARPERQEGVIRALMEQVKDLTDDVAQMKSQLFDSRWEALGKNLEVIDGNIRGLHDRLIAVETRLNELVSVGPKEL